MCTNGINSTLLQSIKDNVHDYGVNTRLAEIFLNADTSDRDNMLRISIDVVDSLITAHSKTSLRSMFENLCNFEETQRYNSNEYGRDHIIHSVTCFFLGIYINEKFIKNHDTCIDPFEWKLASLFHDIAYPLETNKNKTDYFAKILSYLSSQHHIPIDSLDEISILTPCGSEKNSLKLIDAKVKSLLGYKIRSHGQRSAINAKFKYECALMNNGYCHGIFSSLTVLYIASKLYNKYNPENKYDDIEKFNANWNYNYFEKYILNACAAIFLHNFKVITPRMTMKNSGCAYLMKLCDALQNWNRPRNHDSSLVSPNNYSISIHDNKLYFTAPKDEEKKINDELANTINMEHINISSAE